ncbi:MAG: putative flavoprotein involved in transport [Pseudonocardiales bacterium]|nr:putative flavoprotein involved in transport [Pseudonocardiales bacterium]
MDDGPDGYFATMLTMPDAVAAVWAGDPNAALPIFERASRSAAAAADVDMFALAGVPGQVPVGIDTARARPVIPIVMFVFKHALTLRTPMGRAARRQALHHGVPLVRNKLADLEATGVRRIGRITAVNGGRPATKDGPVPDVSTVIWCTGSDPNHSSSTSGIRP